MNCFTYCMDVEHVYSEVVGREVHGLEDLSQCHRVAFLGLAHNSIGLGLQSFFDESQKVFLRRATQKNKVWWDHLLIFEKK